MIRGRMSDGIALMIEQHSCRSPDERIEYNVAGSWALRLFIVDVVNPFTYGKAACKGNGA